MCALRLFYIYTTVAVQKNIYVQYDRNICSGASAINENCVSIPVLLVTLSIPFSSYEAFVHLKYRLVSVCALKVIKIS